MVVKRVAELPAPLPYDPERDWMAWVAVLNERPRGAFPSPTPFVPSASAEAVAAIEEASGSGQVDDKELTLDPESLKRAAGITVHCGEVDVFGHHPGYERWDIFIDALNRYPHPASIACRWLVPTVKNFFISERETPEQLWDEWEREHNRTFQLTLHPRSVRFQGQPPSHDLLDREEPGSSPPVSRTGLDRWRIQAHLSQAPKVWSFKSDVCLNPIPPISTSRLNALTRHVGNLLGEGFYKPEYEAIAQIYRQFLIREAVRPWRPLEERRRLKENLEVLNEAVLRRLTKPVPLRLDHDHLKLYEGLLWSLQQGWKASIARNSSIQFRKRMELLGTLGWNVESHHVRLYSQDRDVTQQRPGEIATVLFCIKAGLEPHHPQTILAAIAEARKAASVLAPNPPGKKKRGRPPKSPRI